MLLHAFSFVGCPGGSESLCVMPDGPLPYWTGLIALRQRLIPEQFHIQSLLPNVMQLAHACLPCDVRSLSCVEDMSERKTSSEMPRKSPCSQHGASIQMRQALTELFMPDYQIMSDMINAGSLSHRHHRQVKLVDAAQQRGSLENCQS